MSLTETPANLAVWRCETTTLAAARAAVEPLLGSSFGLCYTPRDCVLLRGVREGTTTVYHAFEPSRGPHAFNFSGVFEARLFSPVGELRWLNDPTDWGNGIAVFLTEFQADKTTSLVSESPGAWEAPQFHAVTNRLENQYLLWGAAWPDDVTEQSGWSCLATGRLARRVYVPVPGLCAASSRQGSTSGRAADRAVLKSVEYVGRDAGAAGEHGNQAVIAERLMELAMWNGAS
jgi:CRISPR-associated protein (TIGR03984 family)